MKLKTSKSARKRFKVSGQGKLLRRPVNTGHFNAMEGGYQRRRKRGVKPLGKANLKDVEHLMPYLSWLA